MLGSTQVIIATCCQDNHTEICTVAWEHRRKVVYHHYTITVPTVITAPPHRMSTTEIIIKSPQPYKHHRIITAPSCCITGASSMRGSTQHAKCTA